MTPLCINGKEGPYRVCLRLCLHPLPLDRPTTADGSTVDVADSIFKKKSGYTHPLPFLDSY